MSKEITIVVVDDHPIFRQGIANALSLEAGLRVIGEAANGAEAVTMIRSLCPNIAIVDINLPGMNGQQVTRRIVQEKLPTRVMLLTAYDDPEQIIHAAWAGAVAYCSKDIDPGRLVQAVKEMAEGNYVINGHVFEKEEFARWLDDKAERARQLYSEPGNPFHPLSDREMEVLSCVVKGMSNKEIASSLQISHQTVKNHITSILRKFGVEDRTQAVVYALKRGWVKLYSKEEQSQE